MAVTITAEETKALRGAMSVRSQRAYSGAEAEMQ